MLSVDTSGSPHTDPVENREEAPANHRNAEEKLQYTIKGIERKSVELMRDAAKQEGMKIGVWVSRRLREAAEDSLSRDFAAVDSRSNPLPLTVDSQGISGRNLAQQDIIAVLLKMQSDINTIVETQRTLIAGLIKK